MRNTTPMWVNHLVFGLGVSMAIGAAMFGSWLLGVL
jgi:hypothetical protein